MAALSSQLLAAFDQAQLSQDPRDIYSFYVAAATPAPVTAAAGKSPRRRGERGGPGGGRHGKALPSDGSALGASHGADDAARPRPFSTPTRLRFGPARAARAVPAHAKAGRTSPDPPPPPSPTLPPTPARSPNAPAAPSRAWPAADGAAVPRTRGANPPRPTTPPPPAAAPPPVVVAAPRGGRATTTATPPPPPPQVARTPRAAAPAGRVAAARPRSGSPSGGRTARSRPAPTRRPPPSDLPPDDSDDAAGANESPRPFRAFHRDSSDDTSRGAVSPDVAALSAFVDQYLESTAARRGESGVFGASPSSGAFETSHGRQRRGTGFGSPNSGVFARSSGSAGSAGHLGRRSSLRSAGSGAFGNWSVVSGGSGSGGNGNGNGRPGSPGPHNTTAKNNTARSILEDHRQDRRRAQAAVAAAAQAAMPLPHYARPLARQASPPVRRPPSPRPPSPRPPSPRPPSPQPQSPRPNTARRPTPPLVLSRQSSRPSFGASATLRRGGSTLRGPLSASATLRAPSVAPSVTGPPYAARLAAWDAARCARRDEAVRRREVDAARAERLAVAHASPDIGRKTRRLVAAMGDKRVSALDDAAMVAGAARKERRAEAKARIEERGRDVRYDPRPTAEQRRVACEAHAADASIGWWREAVRADDAYLKNRHTMLGPMDVLC